MDEGTSLENWRTFARTVGSNPTPSAVSGVEPQSLEIRSLEIQGLEIQGNLVVGGSGDGGKDLHHFVGAFVGQFCQAASQRRVGLRGLLD